MSEVYFAGPMGRLEGRFHKSENPRAPLVMILHPHPAQGGTMNNKMTYTMFQAFVNMGFSVLRFNYRGVGNSQGTVDGSSNGELQDAIVALDWVQSICTETTVCWIAGYSFGAYIAAQLLMRRPEIKGFVFVSPPTNLYSFDFLTPCPASGLIIQGGKDTVVDESSVSMLVEQLGHYRSLTVEYKMIPDANHIYSGKLQEVYNIITKTVPTLKIKQKHTRKQKKAFALNEDY